MVPFGTLYSKTASCRLQGVVINLQSAAQHLLSSANTTSTSLLLSAHSLNSVTLKGKRADSSDLKVYLAIPCCWTLAVNTLG